MLLHLGSNCWVCLKELIYLFEEELSFHGKKCIMKIAFSKYNFHDLRFLTQNASSFLSVFVISKSCITNAMHVIDKMYIFL